MKANQSVTMYLSYIINNSKPNTIRSFKYTLTKFSEFFSDRELESIKEPDIIEFISSITEDCSASTKNGRVSIIKSLFNFIIEITEANYLNPCLRPMIKKLFKCKKFSSPTLLESDLIDEIIYRTTNERNRLILELMARACMRIGEVLNIRFQDINIHNSTILITEPKSGRIGEKVYLTKKLCNKLQMFIMKSDIKRSDRVFSISYSTAFRMVKKAGMIVNAVLRPHDLRRHMATQASRNNIPLEVVSKIFLRHAHMSTTEVYLGEIDSMEASTWIEQS